jgi:hypothetical protein
MDTPGGGIFDYAILIAILLVSAMIGLFHGFQQAALKYFKIGQRTKSNKVS